ncbi:MAG: FliG C-terminal domain-containing protein, partial [Spirochaetia bacterium]
DELYSIEMVLRVHDRQLAEILSNFDDHSIALILKGKREEIRAKIMHNVSERRATMVSEEYRELGPQRREDVDQVTHEFVEHLRSRVEDGSLLVDDSDDRYI